MSALLYVMRRSFINYFKNLKKHPAKSISFIFLMIFIVFLIFASGSKKKMSTAPFENLVTIFTVATIVIFFLYILSSIEKRGTQFTMSDVNMAFTSPIRPQDLLIYEFIKNISSSGLSIIFFVYQIPNLRNMGFSISQIVLSILVIILFFITLSIINVFVYSLCSIRPKLISIFKNTSKVIPILIAIFVGFKILESREHWFNVLVKIFSQKNIDYIPIIGWYKAMFAKCLTGIDYIFYIYLALNIILILALFLGLYNMNLDYYEDVLSGAEKREELLKIKTKQIATNELNNRNFKVKTRKVTYNYSATNAKAIFHKHLLEYKKTGFGILNLYTLMMVIVAVGYSFFFAKKSGLNNLMPLFYIYAYLSVISSIATKIHLELAKPYIFLIPDSQIKKVFWGTLSSTMKFLVDGAISFIVAGILVKANLISIILAILAYLSLGFVSIYGGLVNYRLFGKISVGALNGILRFLSIIVYVIPGIIVSIIISVSINFKGDYIALLCIIGWNILVSLIMIYFAKGILNHIELN